MLLSGCDSRATIARGFLSANPVFQMHTMHIRKIVRPSKSYYLPLIQNSPRDKRKIRAK
jgi:hypothetical protein